MLRKFHRGNLSEIVFYFSHHIIPTSNKHAFFLIESKIKFFKVPKVSDFLEHVVQNQFTLGRGDDFINNFLIFEWIVFVEILNSQVFVLLR